MTVTGTYDYRLVALSVLLAMVASYAALDLAGRVTAARKQARVFWLAGGATAMGLGIWAMHYIGMLAFTMPMPVLYDLPTVVLSLLAAISASGVALYIVSRQCMSAASAAIGSLVMGGGIVAMHYVGMAAMRLPAVMRYQPVMVSLSVVVAFVVSLIALVLAFRVRDEQRTSWRKVLSAAAMGIGIPLVHYTGMAAVSFSASDKAPDISHAVHISSIGIAAISTVSFLVLAVAVGSAFLGRFIAGQKTLLGAARESEQYFRTLAEAIPEIIFTAQPDGQHDYYNQRWYQYSGLSWEQSRGQGWQAALHPDDLAVCLEKWEHARRSAETMEVEYRFRRGSDGAYRWHLGRTVPVRDVQGAIVKWFGTCTDIHDQKHSQQILEEQIKERTSELLAVNARLMEEMQQRESAQKKLDKQTEEMVRELTERSHRTTFLAKMGEFLQSSHNMKEAYSIVLGFAPRVFPRFQGAVILLDSSRKLLEVEGAWGNCEVSTAVFEANSCWAMRTGRRHFVKAGDQVAQCAHAATVTTSCLCLPILAQGEAVGILHFQAIPGTSEPSESELSLTTTFAEQIGMSVANIKLQEALRNQSTRDALTGLFNRRHLEESLEREIRRATRGNHALGVIIFDLDHFKKFNDTFGHEAGDSVLRATGGLLLTGARVEDIACRFGGEEFVLILPGANLEGTTSRAERLRSDVKNLTVLHQGKSVGAITISVGIATFPTHGVSSKKMLAAADAALYKAKEAGRDRIHVAEPMAERPAASVAAAGESK